MDVANGIKLQVEFNICNLKLQLINLLIELFATNVHLWMDLFLVIRIGNNIFARETCYITPLHK
jgi:hypothetical protein